MRGPRRLASLQSEKALHRREALDWFQSLRGDELCVTLADEIGLGKTVQTLAAGIFEADGDAAPAHIELGDNS